MYHILGLLIFSSDGYKKICGAELQNRAESVDQWCCFSSWCKFLGKARKKPRHYVYFGLFLSILDFKFGANVCGKSRLVPIFTPFATMLWRGLLFWDGMNYDLVKS